MGFYLEASFIAVWILTILWAVTIGVEAFMSPLTQDDEDKTKESRARKAANSARDGVVLLIASVFTAYAARASEGATNALSWVFFALWTAVVGIAALVSSRALLVSTKLLAYLLIFASFIVSWATQSSQ